MGAAFTLSLAHSTLIDASPPELVRIAAASGYQRVGLRLIPVDRPGAPGPVPVPGVEVVRETRQALADTGLRVLDVEVAQIRDGRDLRSYVPVLEAAAELGAAFLLANVYTPDPSAAEDGLAALCDLAAPFGLTVALEFVSFADVSTLAQAVDLVARSGRDNAGVLVDALHFHASRAPAVDLQTRASRLVPYVHLCDGPDQMPRDAEDLRRVTREERRLPGEGGIDLGGIIRNLPRAIVYAVEVQNPARVRALGAEAFARLASETTRAYLSQALRGPG